MWCDGCYWGWEVDKIIVGLEFGNGVGVLVGFELELW